MSVEQANAAQTPQAAQQAQPVQKPQATLYLAAGDAAGRTSKAEKTPHGSDFRIAGNEPVTLEEAKRTFDHFLGTGSEAGDGLSEREVDTLATVLNDSADEPTGRFFELAVQAGGADDLDALYDALTPAKREQLVEALATDGTQEHMQAFVERQAPKLGP